MVRQLFTTCSRSSVSAGLRAGALPPSVVCACLTLCLAFLLFPANVTGMQENAAIGCTGCAIGEVEIESRTRTNARKAIPDTVPDSVPADILLNADPKYGIPLDVIVLTFRKGLSGAQKARIIATVRGVVAGGVPIDPRTVVDGAYLIRIPVTADIAALDTVVQRMRALPDVVSAAMFTKFGSGDAKGFTQTKRAGRSHNPPSQTRYQLNLRSCIPVLSIATLRVMVTSSESYSRKASTRPGTAREPSNVVS